MRAEDDRQNQSDQRGPGRTVATSIVQLRVPRRAPVEPSPGSSASPPLPATAPSTAPSPASTAPSSSGSRSLLEMRRDVEALEVIISSWGEREKGTVAAFARALDALHKEALGRLIRALKSSPAAALALREAVADEVVYAVLRHHELLRPSLQERVEAALASVRPQLAAHGGDVELVAIAAPGAVSVRLLGSCDGCSAAGLTMKAGVERAIQEHCPEVRQVRVVSGSLASPSSGTGVHFVSPFAAADEAGWVEATPLGAIPEGGVLALELEGHSLLLSRSGASVSCFENACAHLGMPLDGGDVADGIITCPHHGFRFALESGECLTVPEVQLQTHAARVRGDRVEVRLS